jgi:leucyl aminopeptidase
MSGQTIEVISTDAEGRLILADALSYARRYQPKGVVDLATLTGACVVALGHIASGLMGNNPELNRALIQASAETGEKIWELPLYEEYAEQIKSDVADIKNAGGRPAAAITAGLFLSGFASGYPWAHLDIAGTAWADTTKGYLPKGATGHGLRLLVQWLRKLGEK